MKIRQAVESDANEMVELFHKLDSETKFMMMEPGEREISIDTQSERIKSFNEGHGNLMAVAQADNVLVGFIVASCGSANRTRHSAYMVIGVERAQWGKGIGKSLIEFMETWAKSASIHRIEFTVVEANTSARFLYRKCGYIEEGIKRDSLKVDGEYVNEIYMSKLF